MGGSPALSCSRWKPTKKCNFLVVEVTFPAERIMEIRFPFLWGINCSHRDGGQRFWLRSSDLGGVREAWGWCHAAPPLSHSSALVARVPVQPAPLQCHPE